MRIIESEVEETKLRLFKDLEVFRTESIKEQKQKILEEKRKEYEAKMLVIRELEAEKQRQEELDAKHKEELQLKRVQQAKQQALQFKHEKLEE